MMRVLIGFAGSLGLLGAAITLVGAPAIYLDLPSAAVVLGLMLFGSLVFTSPKGILAAFRLPFNPQATRAELETALVFWKGQTLLSVAAGVTAVIMGMVAMMMNLSDPKALGPAVAMALLALFYAGVLNVVLILPLRLQCENRLKGL